MSITEVKQWKAAMYLRLSKDDGDKEESYSISNQKDLIKEFAKSFSDVQIVSERVDDGYSGVDFDRPSFELMMADIKSGTINCIIVKDLSRFGRNWIETGKYLDKIFPFLGVRFISINDNIDSIHKRTTSDNLVIPFKNLVNDAYLRDISIKVRSQLEVKRKNGDFIGSFCAYGYKKDVDNHNKLAIDDNVAGVVRDIFKWKIEGMSQQGIANKLNKMDIPSPLEYKNENGERFSTPFKTNRKALWSAVAIKRILTNKIYIGVLEQGKSTTPNYKVTRRIIKQSEEWIAIENAHEALVSKRDFYLANEVLTKDVRTSPNEDALFLFSGVLFCDDCKQSMIRKTVPSKGRKYFYYVCSSNKNNKTCSSHSIKEEKLEKAVLWALQSHVRSVTSMEETLALIETVPYKKQDTEKINKQLQMKQSELESCNQKRLHLYEDFREEIITKSEYTIYKKSYDDLFNKMNAEIEALKEELDHLVHLQTNKNDWINQYKAYANIETLTRRIVVTMIDKILVNEDHRIEILFKYQYNFEQAMAYAQSMATSDADQTNDLGEGVCING